jgi:tetratricopeptide (TPR) repeat protein
VTDVHDSERTKVAAFYSFADGVGRSCMVANIALILASRGYQVLVVDLDLGAPSLCRYLSAFLPEPRTTRLETTPVRLTCEFLDRNGRVDFIGPTADVPASADLAIRRADLTSQGYDFVLVDTGIGEDAAALTGDLADILVLGYRLNKQIMDKAAQYARAIQDSDRGDTIRVLPVPMRVDQNAGGATARMRVEGRRQFAWLLAGLAEEQRQQYWSSIEIPYEPDYSTEEGLPFLDDPSDQRDRLVEAYVKLADQLAPGPAPAAQALVTDGTREQYRAARLAAAGGDAAVTVLHAAADRYWAEWLVAELRRMELTASRRRIDRWEASETAGSELLIVSGHLLSLPDRDQHLAAIATPAGPGSQVQLAVSIDGSRLPGSQLATLGYIDLKGKSAKEAHEELASYYQVVGSGTADHHELHYPGRADSRLGNLPPRDGTCRGRDDAVDRIRDHFTSRESRIPVTLTGQAGIGKTRLALEYAYRFADYYDLVFRISAFSVEAVRAGLAGLAALNPPAHPGGDAGLAALRELQAESAEKLRWLLIYDGVEDPAALDGLLPEPGPGHVILTARDAVAYSSSVLPVAALEQEPARGMLVELIPGILPAETALIADALKAVPLALRLAAGWIRVVISQLLSTGASPGTVTGNAVQEFAEQFASGTGDGAADPVMVAVNLLTERLATAERGPAAMLLLETYAFLAPSGMSRRLLRSPAMLAQLADVDGDIADPVVVHNVLRTLDAYGLSLPGAEPEDPLRIHPRVMEILRDRLPAERRAERTGTVTRMLAASAPLDIDDDVIGHAAIYGELIQHVAPSGALTETDDAVRRWLVNQVRYLWQTETVSAWKSAASLGETLTRHWTAAVPAQDNDPLLLRLRTQLANVYRSLGEFERARKIDGDVLSRQRLILGLKHLRTLMTARSYAADLRLMGNFEDALLEEQSTWQAFSQTLGDDHLMTVIASNNLAVSEHLCGDAEQALERLQTDVVRSRRLRAERPWQEAWLLAHIGTLLRELGRWEESRDTLAEARMEFEDLVSAGVMSATSRGVLRAKAGLLITERRLGRPDLVATERTLEEGRNTYGDLDPDVLAMGLSRAGDLHALRRPDEAVTQAERAQRGYLRLFGPAHPFTRLCEVDLGIYALAAGRLRQADETSASSLSSLEQLLGSRHPWSLAAAVNRANVLAMTGDLESARTLDERAQSEYSRQLGADHRFARIAAKNAAHTSLLLNEPGTVRDSREGIARRQVIELDAPAY